MASRATIFQQLTLLFGLKKVLSFEVELQATEMLIRHVKGVVEITNLYQNYFRRLENPNSKLGMTAEQVQVDKENGVSCHYFATDDIAFRPVIGVIVQIGATGNRNVYTTYQRSY